ncbi:MAG: Fic family protein [Bacteroidales bacterium]|jgi:fido (protein-threonine AMPylation protein)|nr:Fic family protein [Bacteroidales bacterium]
MASTKEQQKDSYKALMDYMKSPEHRTGNIIREDSELGAKQIKRLVETQALTPIIDGWYYVTSSVKQPDPKEWYLNYWQFIVAYLDDKYGEDWCLSSDMSLLFLGKNGILPKQLVIRSSGASNTRLSLPLGYELLEVEAECPDEVVREPRFGLRIYPLHLALLAASPGFYRMYPMEARTCLANLRDYDELARLAVESDRRTGACKVAGGIHSIGYPSFADEIILALRRAGYEAEKDNPFPENIMVHGDQPAIKARIYLMWMKMRPYVLTWKDFCDTCPKDRKVGEIMAMMNDVRIRDGVNSLNLHGLHVTEQLIEESDTPNCDYLLADLELETDDVLAAQGYNRAFRQVKSDILDSMSGGQEPSKLIDRLEAWHSCMVSPFVETGWGTWYRAEGFRKGECPIAQSVHVPVEPGALEDAMSELRYLLSLEPDAFVRAVLGHFFIVYIHPFMDDNAILARLYMNSQLVTGGYPWTVIPEGEKGEYDDVLEKTCENQDTLLFTTLITKAIDRSAWKAGKQG